MGEELADILFVLICVANSQGIDLETSLQQVLDKVWKRDLNASSLSIEDARAF